MCPDVWPLTTSGAPGQAGPSGPQGLGIYEHGGVRDRSLEGEKDERRLKGEERETKSREKRGGIVERTDIRLKTCVCVH